MPARRGHWYNVAILSYNSPKTRAMAQRGEAIGTGRIRTQVTYSGESWAEARYELALAIIKASHMRLAYRVHILRDYEPFVVVNVEHV
jgi:hypothetical protein